MIKSMFRARWKVLYRKHMRENYALLFKPKKVGKKVIASYQLGIRFAGSGLIMMLDGMKAIWLGIFECLSCLLIVLLYPFLVFFLPLYIFFKTGLEAVKRSKHED